MQPKINAARKHPNKKQTMEILEVIKEHDIRWTCLTRCADVDKERAEAMKDAGCDIALFGDDWFWLILLHCKGLCFVLNVIKA